MLIKNARIIDPSQKLDAVKDVKIDNGMIIAVADGIEASAEDKIIDASGKYLIPGLFDMHVHLREPGFEHKENIASGTRAAARGGVTGVLAMPNTHPTVHLAEVVEDIKTRIANTALVDVLLTGSITKNLSGKELSDIQPMIKSGIVAITDDGRTTMSKDFMLEAFKIIKPYGLVLISHSEDHDIVGDGAVFEGKVSRALGYKGITPEVETNIVVRDIEFARKMGAKLHIAHISSKASVEAVRYAQKEGIDVSAEACPHHFILTDDILKTAGTLAKVNPPIKSEEHRKAVEEGLLDGTISCIVTDHAPHTLTEKSRGMDKAPFGISGVELSLSLSYTHFVHGGKMSMSKLVELMAVNPRKRLGISLPQLKVGEPANCCLFDPNANRIIKADEMVSRGKNMPYEGMQLKGDVVMTLLGEKYYEYKA